MSKLSNFDLRILITPLVSSNSSYNNTDHPAIYGSQHFTDLWTESFNSDDQQFHQYQHNEQSSLSLTDWTQKGDHYIWRRGSGGSMN